MEIRVKKMCLQDGFTKKFLKQWGVKIKRDRKFKSVRILILPHYLHLIKSSLGIYFIVTDTGRHLGHIFSPFELDGGLLTFVP